MTDHNHLLLVAGMHRSGTSAVMRVLHTLGWGLGPLEHLMGAAPSNVHGHFELVPLVDFNDRLLDLAGSHWAAPVHTSEALAALAAGSAGDDARRLLHELQIGPGVAVKDPRLCVTLPFWRQVLPERAPEHEQPVVVLPFRHPVEVAKSLEQRDGVPLGHGIELWFDYHHRLLTDADGMHVVPISFHDLHADAETAIASLVVGLRQQVDPTAIVAAAERIDKGERHFDDGDLELLDTNVRDMWTRLQSLTSTRLNSADFGFDEAHGRSFAVVAGLMQVERSKRRALGAELDEIRADAAAAAAAIETAEIRAARDITQATAAAEIVLAESNRDRDKARHHFRVAAAARDRLQSELDQVEQRLASLHAQHQIELDSLREELHQANQARDHFRNEVEVINSSRAGKVVQGVWTARKALRRRNTRGDRSVDVQNHPDDVDDAPAYSPRADAEATTVQPLSPGELPAAVDMATFEGTPDVSVVVPVYGQLAHTAACLASLAAHDTERSFEVIVVDDRSPDDTARWLDLCSGLRVVSNAENLGFLRSTNEGCRVATGTHILLLNNDTTLHPNSLNLLVETIERSPNIGAVGAKLVYPDLSLQEAGSIIWNDGTGWNYGKGHDAVDYRYDFVREVDYCSAAALLVRREPFEQLGWFDERYVPAYYEDTDLCFALRDAGYRVLVQPHAWVTHHEGVSHGTDESSGLKAHQVTNRQRFADKWATQLQAQWPPDTEPRLASWRSTGSRVVVFDHEIPAPDQDSGSLRMASLLQILAESGRRVTFVPHNRGLREPYTTQFHQMGIEVSHGHEDWRKLIADYAPDLEMIICSRPSVAADIFPQVVEAAPAVPLVYDMVDFHGLRLRRRGDSDGSTGRRHADAMVELERAMVRMADVTIAITEDEAAMVRELEPQARVTVVPNVHGSARSTASFEDRSGLLFVGAWRHTPNRDAITWLMDDIMPVVWASNPAIKLHLVGSDMPESIVDPSITQVTRHGWVEDLGPLFDSVRLSIAPLRFGAGMKGKVGDSLIRGVPVVTTPIGVEGFGETAASVLVADDAAGIATHILALHDDEQRWQSLADAGHQAVTRDLGFEAARDSVDNLFGHVRRCET